MVVCGPRKYPHPPHGWSLEILMGGGGPQGQTFQKESMEFLNWSEGEGDSKENETSMGEVWMFSGAIHLQGTKTLIASNADRHPLGSLSNPFLPTLVEGGHVMSPMNVLHWRLEQGGIRKKYNTCESNGLQQKK